MGNAEQNHNFFREAVVEYLLDQALGYRAGVAGCKRSSSTKKTVLRSAELALEAAAKEIASWEYEED